MQVGPYTKTLEGMLWVVVGKKGKHIVFRFKHV